MPDPRARKGRWELAQILRATLVGLMSGCRGLWEAEQLTGSLAPVMRRRLGLSRPLADTTARDLFALKDEHRTMCRLAVEHLAGEAVIARTEDAPDSETTVVRSLKLLRDAAAASCRRGPASGSMSG